MAQTTHIGLHQWQPDDNFLREDFNQDFRKIDTAVQGTDGRITQLSQSTTQRIDQLEQTTTQQITQLEQSTTQKITQLEQSMNQDLENSMDTAAQMVRLYHTKTTSSTYQLSVPLTSVDWSAFCRYDIYITSPGLQGDTRVYIHLNGRTGSKDYLHNDYTRASQETSFCSMFSLSSGRRCGTVLSIYGNVEPVIGYSWGISPKGPTSYRFEMPAQTGVTLTTLRSVDLVLSPSGPIPAGVEVIVFGVGKLPRP